MKWISVKESNPIDSQEVIVCNHRGDVLTGFRTFKGEWWAQFCDEELEAAVVTHWMPMPDPPEPERRGTLAGQTPRRTHGLEDEKCQE